MDAARRHGALNAAEIVRQLSQLELSEGEARVYITLLQVGSCKVSVLAESTGIHRTKVYRLLDNLSALGVVTSTMDRPAIYRAVPPERFFDELVDRKRLELEEITSARGVLEHAMDDLARIQADLPSEVRWRVLRGRSDILRELGRRADMAEERVMLLSGPPIVRQEAGPAGALWDRLVSRAEEGLEVQCLFKLKSHPPVEPRADRSNLQVRLNPHDWEVHFAVMDDELIQWVDVDPTSGTPASDDIALWSTGEGLVESQRRFFTTLWKNAKIVD